MVWRQEDRVLDNQQTDESSSRNVEVARELAERFDLEAERALDRMRTALAVRDAIGIRRSAHSLKELAMSVGGTKAADLARAIEHGDPGAAEEIYPALAASVAATSRALETALISV